MPQATASRPAGVGAQALACFSVRFRGGSEKPKSVPAPWSVKRTGVRAPAAFTLVELLLTLALVLLLVSAAVFSFSPLLRGTQLEEGTGQMESLVRFARAHAANTGRKVQLVFFEEDTNSISSAISIRVVWEPDPLGDPGTFEGLADAFRQTEALNGLVQVEAVELLGPDGQNLASPSLDLSEQELEGPRPFAPITFYPDGSGDSAQIVLVSRAPDEEQQMSVRIDGLTGAIRHQLVTSEPDEGLDETNTSASQQNRHSERPETASAPKSF